MALGPLVLGRDQQFILLVHAWHSSPAPQYSQRMQGNIAHLFGEYFTAQLTLPLYSGENVVMHGSSSIASTVAGIGQVNTNAYVAITAIVRTMEGRC